MDGRTYPITAAVTVLGRGTEADVIVDDAGVSRRHAEVRAQGDQLTVVDLGSTNGTYVDGEKIAGVAALVDGSRIRVGRSQLTVRFGSW
jgi:pSer/pThr/pTyr-binding forkhead associated (FHA) protein